jgi:hypothetical protein
MTVPESELGQGTQHCVPGKAKIQQPLWERYWLLVSGFFLFFFFEPNGRRSTIPHMQAANACWCKLEQEEASSSVRTEWQTESSPTAVLATNLDDSESPSQKLVHLIRALQIKCKPPTKRAHSVRHKLLPGANIAPATKSTDGKKRINMSLKLNIGPPAITELCTSSKLTWNLGHR